MSDAVAQFPGRRRSILAARALVPVPASPPPPVPPMPMPVEPPPEPRKPGWPKGKPRKPPNG